jgi:hypothetical protein
MPPKPDLRRFRTDEVPSTPPPPVVAVRVLRCAPEGKRGAPHLQATSPIASAALSGAGLNARPLLLGSGAMSSAPALLSRDTDSGQWRNGGVWCSGGRSPRPG